MIVESVEVTENGLFSQLRMVISVPTVFAAVGERLLMVAVFEGDNPADLVREAELVAVEQTGRRWKFTGTGPMLTIEEG